jgi:hypothetical protein
MSKDMGTAGGREGSPVKMDTVGGVPTTGFSKAPEGVGYDKTIEHQAGKGIGGSNPGAR